MLSLCDQAFELVWTDFGGGVTRTAEWRRQVNEMGEIPVLEENGVMHSQTAPILLRLAKRFEQFQGTSEQEAFEVLRWLFWDNHKLTSYMASYRFLRTFTPSADAAVLDFLKGRVDTCLAILEQHLADRAFVAGDAATVADISMIGYLCFPADESGYDLSQSHPAIHNWINRIAALPGWHPPYELLPGQHLPRYC